MPLGFCVQIRSRCFAQTVATTCLHYLQTLTFEKLQLLSGSAVASSVCSDVPCAEARNTCGQSSDEALETLLIHLIREGLAWRCVCILISASPPISICPSLLCVCRAMALSIQTCNVCHGVNCNSARQHSQRLLDQCMLLLFCPHTAVLPPQAVQQREPWTAQRPEEKAEYPGLVEMPQSRLLRRLAAVWQPSVSLLHTCPAAQCLNCPLDTPITTAASAAAAYAAAACSQM